MDAPAPPAPPQGNGQQPWGATSYGNTLYPSRDQAPESRRPKKPSTSIQLSTVDTGIPFRAWHFEYSTEYSTYIPCQQTAIGRPTVDSGACRPGTGFVSQDLIGINQPASIVQLSAVKTTLQSEPERVRTETDMWGFGGVAAMLRQARATLFSTSARSAALPCSSVR
eukprot:1113902-Prorocentrum_minimum.AAC.1